MATKQISNPPQSRIRNTACICIMPRRRRKRSMPQRCCDVVRSGPRIQRQGRVQATQTMGAIPLVIQAGRRVP